MKKRRNNSAHVSLLQISLLLVLLAIPAILLTSSFIAAAPNQDGFYPPLPQKAQVAPTSTSEIILVSRLSDARAAAATMFNGSDNPPAQIQTDFLPANLSNSAMVSGESGAGSGHSTSNSSIDLNNQLGYLQVSGDGTASAGAVLGGASGSGAAKLVVLSFTVAGGGYPYSLTGQLNANSSNLGGSGSSTATAKLTAGAATVFEVTASVPPTVPLSQTGMLPPGDYTLSVELSSAAHGADAGGGGGTSCNANFNFALGSPPPPTPTPTPTPVPTATPTPTPPQPTPTPTPPPPTPTPGPPTPTPTPGPPTPTPGPPTPTPTVGPVTVSAPVFTMSTNDGFVVNNQPVTTTFVSPSLNYIGFQGDMIFDSAVAAPSPPGTPVSPAGLTASGWTIGANILNSGPGTLKTLRVSAYSNDGVTPLNGSGTLYVINWKRVSSNPGNTTALTWGSMASGFDFEFVDFDLNTISAQQQNNGQITIVSGGTPTPSPTPVGISGTVLYCSNPTPGPVPNVVLALTGSGSGSTLSDVSGNYTFSSLAYAGTYTVTPTKSALVPGSNGINTVDVLAVQRHFLNIFLIPAGCRLTAADVNNDFNITTVDVVAIQRFYLGLSTGLANVGKYQFNPSRRTYIPLISNQSSQNYDTLIFGDVAPAFVTP